ncbi:MAG: hypothetical protein HETSPECPRED_003164 [Heterodermia speciosa]|uniref:Hikeshi-like domain-containing protein n=1 Tax=Heterodermia speciosa TaxID=116794 RepID=A0A8H3F2V1_9LECA|nr:MAG: hypothetical protein HETSPECPRED_003164 [Heterodermia speciosa]
MSAPAPFALIVPSSPVYAAPTALSPTQYVFSLPSSPSFTHIVVFLLPGATLPPDSLVGVYVQSPGEDPGFRFLGAIGNDKQSAIFRVGDAVAAESNGHVAGSIDQDEMVDIDASASTGISATASKAVGLSIEPAASVQAQLATLKSSEQSTNPASTALVVARQQHVPLHSTKALAQKIIMNAFNFLASFTGSTGPGEEEVVPLKSFKAWWEKFERRIEVDPSFLEREGDN